MPSTKLGWTPSNLSAKPRTASEVITYIVKIRNCHAPDCNLHLVGRRKPDLYGVAPSCRCHGRNNEHAIFDLLLRKPGTPQALLLDRPYTHGLLDVIFTKLSRARFPPWQVPATSASLVPLCLYPLHNRYC